MAITVQNIVDKAAQIASRIGGQNVSISEAMVELLLPHVIQNVLANLSANRLRSLRQTYELSFVDNEAITPDLAMPEYFRSARLYDEALTRTFSFCESAATFNDSFLPSICDYWMIEDDTIRVKLQDTETFSGGFLFDAVSSPEIPASPTEAIAITQDLADDISIELARAALGQEPYMKLGKEDK